MKFTMCLAHDDAFTHVYIHTYAHTNKYQVLFVAGVVVYFNALVNGWISFFFGTKINLNFVFIFLIFVVDVGCCCRCWSFGVCVCLCFFFILAGETKIIAGIIIGDQRKLGCCIHCTFNYRKLILNWFVCRFKFTLQLGKRGYTSEMREKVKFYRFVVCYCSSIGLFGNYHFICGAPQS